MRNLSPHQMFVTLAGAHMPACAFRRDPTQDFATWQGTTLPLVLATLGQLPAAVPPNPELMDEWEHEGTVKQRWLIDVQEGLAAALIVARPADLAPGERRPAICCWHGHGEFGKESVMGNASSPARRTEIEQHNYDYGHQMAQAGFVTYALDWMGSGERNDSNRPHWRTQNFGRDWCNLLYLQATLLGMTTLGMNVCQGKAATDFVCTLPWVDPEKLGVMGLSGGGTMALWTGLFDPRFTAIEIICYSDLFAVFAMRDLYVCGMQITPGLFALVDVPDLQGLLAPRPLLVDIGVYDTCFQIDSAMACYRQVERIYQAAGAPERLELDHFAGEHAWGGNKSVAFFTQYLCDSVSSGRSHAHEDMTL